MKIAIRIFVLLIILGIFGGTLYYLYSKNEEKPVVYETSKAFVTNIVMKTVATGSVVPRREVDVKSRVSGIIDELFVEAGDKVKKGDILARVKIIPDMVSLNNAESRLSRAKIALDDAQVAHNRQKKLFEEKVIAESEYLPFKLALNNANEEVNAAENNLALIKEGATKKTGEVSNTMIRATVTGTVLIVPVKVGSSVIESNTFNEGTTIATVADLGEMIFQGKVDESEVGKIKTGMEMVLNIGAIENESFKANLEFIAPKGVEDKGAIKFEIKAAITLKDSVFIRSGYSANADIVLDKRDSVLAIPESLITFSKDSAFVEVETAPQTFEKRYIKTGLSDGINIEVLSGIDSTAKLKQPLALEKQVMPE
ncbi:MAG: Multidrug resistance protein MdtA [Bacteroidia bacterium]|nr:Multidrug resistance protein MdtA [Bacteroidia bacterium]